MRGLEGVQGLGRAAGSQEGYRFGGGSRLFLLSLVSAKEARLLFQREQTCCMDSNEFHDIFMA